MQLFKGIRFRISVVLLVIIFGGLFLFEAIEYNREKGAMVDELSQLAERKAHRLAESLSLPIWEIDRQWVKTILDNEIDDRSVYAIRVDADGELFAGVMRDTQWRPADFSQAISGDYILKEEKVLHDGEVIGKVSLYITKQFLIENLREQVLAESLIVLLMGLLSSLLLFALLNSMVLTPIQQVLKAAAAIASGDYSKSVDTIRNDEIGQLGAGINAMKEEIERRELERDRAFASLRESERRIRSLIENVHTAVLVRDRDTRVTVCNPLAQKLIGLSEKQLLWKSVIEQEWHFIHEDGSEMKADDYPSSRVIRTGAPIRNATMGILRPEMEAPLWVLVNAEPMFDEQKNISSVIVSFSNITPLKEAEAALRVSEGRFRSFVENAADAFFQIDANGRFRDVNRLACESLGYSRDELLTMSVPDIELNMDMEAVKTLADSMRPGDLRTIEGMHKRKDGHAFPVEVRVGKIEQGKEQFLLAHARDISERKMAEQKIRRFSRALEQSGEAVMITDANGCIEHVNPAFSEITGYMESEVLGKRPNILKSDAQDPALFEQMWQTLIQQRVWQGKIINRKKSGESYPAMLTISPIRDEKGEVVNYVSLQQNLEQVEALEAQLQQAQKMEAIGTLVGGIAHDFNNTLAGITGNLFLAKRKVADEPDVVARLDSVEKLAFRAAATIQQLLAFSRKAVVRLNPISLSSFAKEVVKLLQASVPESIALSLEVEDSDLKIRGDVNQLQQVLMNMINNACDAVADAENPSIVIRLKRFVADEQFMKLHRDLKADRYACIEVADNGTGIKAEHLAHIFEPFFTTKEVGQGSGLGLAMVFGMVKSHGGVVVVDTDPGNGTTMQVYLPLLEDDAALDLMGESDEVVEGNGETILVVDDNETVRDTAKELLEGLGYRVMTAIDGKDAIDKYSAHQGEIDLCILDVVMPRMGGIDALKGIREINPAAKAMFATGYDKISSMGGRKGIENERLISKPYTASHLSQVVREMLDRA